VADRNPMLMDVTIILAAANMMPGIFNTCNRLAVKYTNKRTVGLFVKSVEKTSGFPTNYALPTHKSAKPVRRTLYARTYLHGSSLVKRSPSTRHE